MANSLPINGITTGDLSDKLKNLFTPQGSTFAIWGVIYSLLLIFIIVLLLFGTKKLRNIGGDLGSAIKNFKKSVNDDKSDKK